MPTEREAPVGIGQKLREGAVDLIAPERKFSKEITREIRVCLNYFHASWMRGISVTIGRFGREGCVGQVLDVAKGGPRGYFWEKDGAMHVVGQEVMTRKQKKALLEAIHGVTLPYRESKYWEQDDDKIFGKNKKV
jgi:hypothetical protein